MSSRITIDQHDAGKTILDWLCAHLGISREDAQQLLARRKVRINGAPCSSGQTRLRRGQRVEVPTQPTDAPDAQVALARSQRIPIRHVDEAIVVVEKPAGLTTMRHPDEAAEFGPRGRRYLPPTLADLLPELLASHNRGKPVSVRAVHRLDRDTTGLVVFARTPEAERHLGEHFRAHTVERLYQAVVRGKAVAGRIESYLVRDRGDGRRGSTSRPGEGQRAVTHVEVIEVLGEFTLVQCRLETGRTHQVRIHLGEAGTPLCGERVYDRPLHGKPLPDTSYFARPALHAATLGLEHPTTGQRLRWTAELPPDMVNLLRHLRKRMRQA
jgi:23S rRNA pseudouridine1911/1915/1917 synthase